MILLHGASKMAEKVSPRAKQNRLHYTSVAKCLTEKRMRISTVVCSLELSSWSSLVWLYYFTFRRVNSAFHFVGCDRKKQLECTSSNGGRYRT